MSAVYDAALFDLFSGLLDSQQAYDDVAGSAALGRRWRTEHSRLCYSAGDYRPHDDLGAEAAAQAGVPVPPRSLRASVRSTPGLKPPASWRRFARQRRSAS